MQKQTVDRHSHLQNENRTSSVDESLYNLDEIASLVSYELRTPLTSIRAALGLLLTGMFGTLPKKGQRMLEIALNNTDRLLRLAEELEHDPKLSRKNVVPEPSSFNSAADPATQRLALLSLWRQRTYYDRLTGLPNQTLWIEHLEQALVHAQQKSDQAVAVLLIGLDRFQIINDSLGRAAGDRLLIAVAQRLEAYIQPIGIIARLQEDEFAVLLEDVKSIDDLVSIAQGIQQLLSDSFNFENQGVFVTASIGIAWSQEGHACPEDLLYDADTAMHQAKNQGKDRYEIFDIGVRVEAISRLRLETDLRLALERQEFQIYYQPIVSLKTSKLTGFEALLRWQHPEQGMIFPTQFIPLAEETGLINPIGEWVLRQACQQLQIWQQRFPVSPPLTISVNLSTQQITQPDLVEQVRQILDETGVNPNSVKLEITESIIMENPETAIAVLKQLKQLGLELCVDDFGTGYSSLAYLHYFPVDTLKIDRSFISQIDSEGEQLEIVQTIIRLAWNLGMNVVTEGVETPNQLAQLKSLRCEYGQGYLFSQPVDMQAAQQLIGQKL
ncbi:EAL domain-containing protein [Pseudanabaena sp. FACHB-2040]|uniref:putative bifunctional diguanylate cyclase/phosphodiesterase n=1 Tax=Pseudanabaena sp. FACHB-2040 TaxID=2692859 RepID=UPI0016824B3A|nr:EAL domain-containing protein [Pseudanabaena sp. FACHB-2040]MBD2256099.1 EAL domain-containing protein [Pseudanabaena sp. FACHB-2040]